MRDASTFKITLDELERDVRVAAEDRVESADSACEPAPDPRGPQPDRDWLAAGG